MNPNFTTTISVAQSPQEAFNAINNVRGWWSAEIDGSTDKLGAELQARGAFISTTACAA